MDKWLVRTDKNQISGPFAREQIRQMIQTGQLTIHDEVCNAGSYWIYLHERDEVKSQLDVIVMYTPKDEGETTETDTQVAEMIAKSEQPPEKDEFIDLSQAEEDTAVMSNRALRQFRPKRAGDSASQPQTEGLAPVPTSPTQVAAAAFEGSRPAAASLTLEPSQPLKQTRELAENEGAQAGSPPISSVPVPDGRPGFLQNFVFALILLMGITLVVVIWMLKAKSA